MKKVQIQRVRVMSHDAQKAQNDCRLLVDL